MLTFATLFFHGSSGAGPYRFWFASWRQRDWFQWVDMFLNDWLTCTRESSYVTLHCNECMLVIYTIVCGWTFFNSYASGCSRELFRNIDFDSRHRHYMKNGLWTFFQKDGLPLLPRAIPKQSCCSRYYSSASQFVCGHFFKWSCSELLTNWTGRAGHDICYDNECDYAAGHFLKRLTVEASGGMDKEMSKSRFDRLSDPLFLSKAYL